jgi:hypothetical protein
VSEAARARVDDREKRSTGRWWNLDLIEEMDILVRVLLLLDLRSLYVSRSLAYMGSQNGMSDNGVSDKWWVHMLSHQFYSKMGLFITPKLPQYQISAL